MTLLVGHQEWQAEMNWRPLEATCVSKLDKDGKWLLTGRLKNLVSESGTRRAVRWNRNEHYQMDVCVYNKKNEDKYTELRELLSAW